MDINELLRSPIAFLAPAGILDGLTGEQASARPAGPGHNIVEILAHLTYWQDWFLGRCEGRDMRMAKSAADGWPAAAAADWDGLRERFLAGLERGVALGEAPDRPLQPALEFAPLAHYTVKDALTHVAVHNAHHLGQIVTLRQLLGAWPPPQGSWTW